MLIKHIFNFLGIKMKKTLLAALIATSSIAMPVMANNAGDILVRAGLTTVQPDNTDATVYAADMTVNVAGGPAATVSVEDNTQLGLNLVYFYTDKIAFELLAATPFSHDIKVDIGASEALLGETKHLPPVLSALYYFNDADSKIQPYVGIGLNYTIFFQDNFAPVMQGDAIPVTGLGGQSIAELSGALGLPDGTESVGLRAKDLKLKNSWGLALQAGVDYHIDEKWHVNASARYIDIDTTATFKATALEVPGKVDVSIDPWVFTLAVGYKF